MWAKSLHTPANSWVPNARHGEEIKSGYLTHAVSGDPRVGKVATETMPSHGSPTLSTGTKSEVAILAISAARLWAEWPLGPCRLGVPALSARTKSKLAT